MVKHTYNLYFLFAFVRLFRLYARYVRTYEVSRYIDIRELEYAYAGLKHTYNLPINLCWVHS